MSTRGSTQTHLPCGATPEVLAACRASARLNANLLERTLATQPHYTSASTLRISICALSAILKILECEPCTSSVPRFLGMAAQACGRFMSRPIVLCLFPFEAGSGRNITIPATFVGHPLATAHYAMPIASGLRRQLGHHLAPAGAH